MNEQILALLLVAPLLLGSGCDTARGMGWKVKQTARSTFTDQGRYERVIRKAYEADQLGEWERAERLFWRARKMRPEHVVPAYGHAVALAAQGRDGESMAALRKAVDLGFYRESLMEYEPTFESYRSGSEFLELLERVRANSDDYRAALREAHRLLPDGSAASFVSLAALQYAFHEEGMRLERQIRKLEYEKQELERRRHRMRKLAALELYADEHPDASDLEEAAVVSLRLYHERASGSWRRWWKEEAADLRRSAVEFLAAHPESSHRTEVLLYRAAAKIFGTMSDSYDWRIDPVPSLDCSSATEELKPLADGAETDKWAAGALALEALCRYQTAPDDSDGVRQSYKAYLALPEPEWNEMIPLHIQLQREIRMLSIRVDGPPPFSVTTFDGLEVGLDRLPGEITLLEFWAPG